MAMEKPRAPKRKKPEDRRPSKPRPSITKNMSKNKKQKNSKNPNLVPLGKNKLLDEIKEEEEKRIKKKEMAVSTVETVLLSSLPAAQQLSFFLDRFQSANELKLSPLELEAYKDTCMIELSKSINQDVDNLNKHIKDAFGESWKDVLSDAKISEGESWKDVLSDAKISEGMIEPGSPAVLVISVSALKSLELLRGLKIFTRECRPAKLFAKHMKVEEQVELLKSRVNIASGTPSRIKKLIDMDALLLSRLAVIVLDMRSDAKGYSLLTLPQVSAEFWDLYKSHLNERIIQGSSRICFYGPAELRKPKKAKIDD